MEKLKEYANWLGIIVAATGAALSIIGILIGDQGFLAQSIAIVFLAIGVMILVYATGEKQRKFFYDAKGQVVKTSFPQREKIVLLLIPVLCLSLLIWQLNRIRNIQLIQTTSQPTESTSPTLALPTATYQPQVTSIFTATSANALQTDCNEFKVVFLVDQSNSMFGFDVNGEAVLASDPLGNRFYALRSVIDVMGDRAYTQNTIYHVAIVYFGTSADVVMPWKTISSSNTMDEIRDVVEATKSHIPLLEQSMGETLFLPAFEMATFLLQQDIQIQSNCVESQVIVITDGKPKTNDIPSFDWQDHMRELAMFVQDNLRPLNADIYVVDMDATDSYREDVFPYWLSITEDYRHMIKPGTNRTFMPSMLREILIPGEKEIP